MICACAGCERVGSLIVGKRSGCVLCVRMLGDGIRGIEDGKLPASARSCVLLHSVCLSNYSVDVI